MAEEKSEYSSDAYEDMESGLDDVETSVLAAKAAGDAGVRQTPEELMKQHTDNMVVKIGMILNPTQPARIYGSNPLNTDNVVNQYNHKVCLVVEGINGGYVQPGHPTSKTGQYTSQNPEDRTQSEMYTNSIQEIVPLTYPIMWTDPTNWMGINYLPPVGAKVLVGFGRNALPYILGYLNEREGICKPVLKPGEIAIKGYGNNYICFRSSNKLDLMVSAQEGAQDLDDTNIDKTAEQESNCYIRMDADNGFISMGVGKNQIFITNDGITLSAGGESVIGLTSSGISFSAASISENAQIREGSGDNNQNHS